MGMNLEQCKNSILECLQQLDKNDVLHFIHWVDLLIARYKIGGSIVYGDTIITGTKYPEHMICAEIRDSSITPSLEENLEHESRNCEIKASILEECENRPALNECNSAALEKNSRHQSSADDGNVAIEEETECDTLKCEDTKDTLVPPVIPETVTDSPVTEKSVDDKTDEIEASCIVIDENAEAKDQDVSSAQTKSALNEGLKSDQDMSNDNEKNPEKHDIELSTDDGSSSKEPPTLLGGIEADEEAKSSASSDCEVTILDTSESKKQLTQPGTSENKDDKNQSLGSPVSNTVALALNSQQLPPLKPMPNHNRQQGRKRPSNGEASGIPSSKAPSRAPVVEALSRPPVLSHLNNSIHSISVANQIPRSASFVNPIIGNPLVSAAIPRQQIRTGTPRNNHPSNVMLQVGQIANIRSQVLSNQQIRPGVVQNAVSNVMPTAVRFNPNSPRNNVRLVMQNNYPQQRVMLPTHRYPNRQEMNRPTSAREVSRLQQQIMAGRILQTQQHQRQQQRFPTFKHS